VKVVLKLRADGAGMAIFAQTLPNRFCIKIRRGKNAKMTSWEGAGAKKLSYNLTH